MTYTVQVAREGDAWTAQVAELPAAHTWARSLLGLDHDVREIIALVEDLPEGAEAQLDLDWDFTAAGPDAAAAAQVAAERRRAQAAVASMVTRSNRMVQQLSQAGWSQRDISGVLGITPGRVSQILSKRPERQRDAA